MPQNIFKLYNLRLLKGTYNIFNNYATKGTAFNLLAETFIHIIIIQRHQDN